ncbi:MAG: amino acid adenylation domain-containing protein [Kastovskya adunca ATA6-11-RM4]|nr:amino acid adenylation domain-containing protein [Kastovskya adunca ATA6-11-RM4]
MENIADIYELSPMQQGLLFHSLYAPDSGVYFNQFSCTIEGNLNVAAFQQAWQQVVERYPILRTAFYWEELEKPLQVVHRQVEIPWQQHDWRHLSATKQQEQLATFLKGDREQGFELNQAPLMRCILIQFTDDTYQFIWSHHHLLIDGWSLPIILKEVFAFYDAFDQGKELYLPTSRPYRDYIIWLQQQDLSQAEAFWRQELQGFTAPTPLAVGKAANLSNHKPTYAEQDLQLSQAIATELQSVARQHRLTLNTLVQGAWAFLLSRYSGEAEVVFGATVSGRPNSLPKVESMVGLFINTLPVRVQVPGDASLLLWLQQLMQQQVAREPYSYSSLVEIQGWIDVKRDLPLFESILGFENYPVDASIQELSDNLTISNVHIVERTNYPLSVIVLPGTKLGVRMIYDCHRFDDSTIKRMLGHFQTLLEAIATNPHQRLCDLPLLTPTERHQMLVEWNNTQADYPKNQCIHELFAAQAEKKPDAVAVVFENQQLTYHELNCRANQLAHYLQKLGVKPEVLVGICSDRSIEMVVGMLGILKAGGAYLPLDPSDPQERLTFMLNDAQVSVLLTQKQLLEELPELQAILKQNSSIPNPQVICLDADWGAISQESETNPVSPVTVENLAYVIYTSGSTGQPKGVAIPHKGLLNLVFWHQRTFKITPSDRATQLARIAFDASVWELYPYLAAGASVYLVESEIIHSPVALRDWLISQEITIAFVPTPLAESLFTLEWSDSALRIMLIGGDKLHQYPWASLPFKVINNYGPTENTVVTTSGLMLADEQGNGTPGIGRAIANTQLYVLDQFLQPVPIGITGELYIGGASLARGYLNRPELTAERFILNPFSNDPESRLYKTGDLVRYQPDGNLEFCDRIDYQVKIRGFRIELGEIEALLRQHPTVQEAIVIAREDVPGNPYLAAYIVPNPSPSSAKELRNWLKQKLPEYMMPSAYVMLESLPLTSNGKIDRRALPACDRASLAKAATIVPPRDALERQLVHIWEETLEISPIGVQDNFFELGGHSLVAVRLMAQIQEQFEKNLPLATLFQAGTIEQMARLLRQENADLPWSPLVPIQSNGSKRPFFCVPGAGGNVIYLYALAHHLGSDQPFYGLQASGLDGKSQPYTRIEDMAAQYIEAIQSLQPEGPYLLGGHSYGGQVAFEMAIQLEKLGHKVALLAILDTPAPLPGSQSTVGMDWDNARWLTQIAGLVERLYETNLEVSYEILQSLEPDKQFNYLKQGLERVNLLPPEAGTTQVRGLVEVYKANLQAHYVPQDIYPGRITLFQSSEEHPKDFDSQESAEILREPQWDWSQLSTQPIEVYHIPGDHIAMMVEPHVRVLANQLRDCLEQAQLLVR